MITVRVLDELACTWDTWCTCEYEAYAHAIAQALSRARPDDQVCVQIDEGEDVNRHIYRQGESEEDMQTLII